MENKIIANVWKNININSLTKKTLQYIKRLCVLVIVLCCLVFCLGSCWFGFEIYNQIHYLPQTEQFQKIQSWANWFLLSAILFNTIPTVLGIKIFIDIKNLINWNIKNLLFDLSMCNFILQFFSLFGGLVCSFLIIKKLKLILNYPIIIENKSLYVNNYNNLQNKIITNFKYSFISQPNLTCNIKLIKFDKQQKQIIIHVFTQNNFFKIYANVPKLYVTWPLKIESNFIPIVQHIYLDPEQKIIKINYLSQKNTCFDNNADFNESIIILPI